MTSSTLIYRSLRDIGCLRPGQSTSTDVLNDCRDALNEMIDAWQIDGLMVYASVANIWDLTAGVQSYTIGPTGALVGERPTDILDANIILNTSLPSIRRPLRMLNVDEWASIRVRDIPFALPTAIYYDRGFGAGGNATVNLWPGPLASYQLELFTQQTLQNFPDLSTNYEFPPAYGKAMRKNLAVEIAPMMEVYNKLANLERPRPALLQLVTQQAAETLAVIKSYNAPTPMTYCDPAFTGGGSGGFNWMTGETGR